MEHRFTNDLISMALISNTKKTLGHPHEDSTWSCQIQTILDIPSMNFSLAFSALVSELFSFHFNHSTIFLLF